MIHVLTLTHSTPTGDLFVCPTCGYSCLIHWTPFRLEVVSGEPGEIHQGAAGVAVGVIDERRLEPFREWMERRQLK